jgi:hypothetical protein
MNIVEVIQYPFKFAFVSTLAAVFFAIFVFSPQYIIPPGCIRVFLERASYEINSVADGFTSRPYYLGAFEYTKEEAEAFAKALEKIFAAKSYFHKNSIMLIIGGPLFWYFPFIKPNLDKCTYFEIDFSGNLSVHIAERDYKRFKSELTFDELCHNMGEFVWLLFRTHKEHGVNKMSWELSKSVGWKYAKKLAAEEENNIE